MTDITKAVENAAVALYRAEKRLEELRVAAEAEDYDHLADWAHYMENKLNSGIFFLWEAPSRQYVRDAVQRAIWIEQCEEHLRLYIGDASAHELAVTLADGDDCFANGGPAWRYDDPKDVAREEIDAGIDFRVSDAEGD